MSFPFHIIPIPGRRQVHVHTVHTIGPVGPNGTQQFPKLTDCELICILNPLIHTKIMCNYAKTSSDEQNARNILANLKPIVQCATEILCQIEHEHGYCSCECLGAMMRNQSA